MAMIVFTLLNGLGVVFLLYVLYQFCQEGRRSKVPSVMQYEIELPDVNGPEVFVVTRPVSVDAHAGLSVLPMQIRARGPERNIAARNSANGIIELPVTRTEGHSDKTLRSRNMGGA